MARYAKDFAELEYNQLVQWDGKTCVFWDEGDQGTAELIPLETMKDYEGDTESLDEKSIMVPLRQILIPEPVKAEPEVLRAFFRLDVMPWDLLDEGKFPFSSATPKLKITEDDLLCIIDRLPMFRNTFLFDAWRKSFFHFNDSGIVSHIMVPYDDNPGFTFYFFAMQCFKIIDWLDPEEGDWVFVRELRDCYLQSKGKPLKETVLPAFSGRDMAKKLEKYCETHPVTDEIREFYIRILDDCLRHKDIGTYAYAYYGGNAIVPCDWKKSEQALLKWFDPDNDPPVGDEWAANSLGYIYGSDRLGKPDYRKAFICFLYAANHRVTEATYKLSDLYRLGLGVRKDPEMAWTILNKLYQKMDKRHISRGKYADIMLRMGYCYRDGVGVAPDRETALKFFLDAKRGIEARLKKKPGYGDEVVARNIQAAIDSVK